MKIFRLIVICLLLCVTLTTCKNESKQKAIDSSRLEYLNFQFVTTRNEAFLDSIFMETDDVDYFKKNKLTMENIDFFSNAFLHKKKFKQYLILVNDSEIESREKKYLLNIISAYDKYSEGDILQGNKFIDLNIKIISEYLNSNSRDQMAYFDLLYMKSHLVSDTEILNHIDSLCVKKTELCSQLGKKNLIDNVKSYRKEFNEILN